MKVDLTRICVLFAVLAICGCGRAVIDRPEAPGKQSLPRPSQLARLAPQVARSASAGPLVDFERTLQSNGLRILDVPGGSANVDIAGTTAVIHGNASQLNFAFYQISTSFDSTDMLTQFSLDYAWASAAPAAPDGLYVGFPDQAHDRWIWLDAGDFLGGWHDATSLGINGVDPATHPSGSFIALVNASSEDVTVKKLALRFRVAASIDGDEQLYYTSQAATDAPGVTGVGKATLDGNPSQLVLPYDVSGFYSKPFVTYYFGSWYLLFQRTLISPAYHLEIWLSGLDGSLPTPIENAVADAAYIPQGWEYGASKGYMGYSAVVDGSNPSLWVINGDFSTGRLSRDFDVIQKAVPNLSVDHGVTAYSAYASVLTNAPLDIHWIERFDGNPPFPIDATPIQLYAPVGNEDARDPDMVEVDRLDGTPSYHIYFAARNRDGTNYNLYRYDFQVGEVEPCVIDSAHNLRYPAASWDGRYLAFQRTPLGSLEGATGELVVVDLVHPEAGEEVVASDCGGQISWFDTTP